MVVEAFITVSIESDKEQAIGMVRKDIRIIGSAFERAEKAMASFVQSKQSESTMASRMKTILPELHKVEARADFELIVDVKVEDEFKSNSEIKEQQNHRCN